MKELCFNLWYYLDKQQKIAGLSARAYLLSGEESKKSSILEALSWNDYKIVPVHDLPQELKKYSPQGVWYGLLKELGIEVFYKEIFKDIKNNLSSYVDFPEDKLFFATPLYDFGHGYVPALIGNGFITERSHPNSDDPTPASSTSQAKVIDFPGKRKYPQIDRGNFMPTPHKDIGWSEGQFKNGRPFRVECWAQHDYTYLTFYLSVKGIEGVSEKDLKDMLISEGLVEFDDEKFVAYGLSGLNLKSEKMIDASGNEMWSITVIVRDDDGTYIKTHFRLKRYEFPPKKAGGQGKRKPKDVESADYFLALAESVDENHYTTYHLYFVNNTSEQIRAMLAIRPGAMTKIKKGATIDDVDEDLIKDKNSGIEKYRNMPPKSFIKVNWYHGWEFDWENAMHLFLETHGEEKHLNFYIKKYIIGWDKKIDDIPVLHKSGWIIL